MYKKSIISLSVLVTAFGLVLSACTTPNEAPTDAIEQDGDVAVEEAQPEIIRVEGVSGEVLLDPAVVSLDNEDSLLISSYIYAGLVSMENGEVVPDLAASWTMTDDGLNYQFSLHPDATFENGTQVTADDVLANFNRWFDPESELREDDQGFEAWLEHFQGYKGEEDEAQSPLSLFDGIEKVDDTTVLLHLNRPVEELLEILASPSFSILNPDALAAGNYGSSRGLVLSSGPYYVASWSDEGIELLPNSSYWGSLPEAGLEFTFE